MGGISYNYNAANAEFSHRHLYPSVSRLLQNVPPGAVVMDAGCGNGSFISLFQDRNWQLHGSDLSPTGIEIARKTFPNINFFLADGQTLYADFLKTVGPVDVVLSTEVIEHVYDPRGFLRNCYELLKPGGIIILTTRLSQKSSPRHHRQDGPPLYSPVGSWPHQILVAKNIDPGASGNRLHQHRVWNSMVLKAVKPI
jgi:2-polyprenyl-3-methyl-5-hydroxy-6-metoxy-1,4-benzoquinol methylase